MENCTKVLVVNADDFGLSEQINRGIESAFIRGILRSASIMPNGPAFYDAVRIARLRRGWVLASIARSWMNRAPLSRVLEAGIEPTHLDSHQHLHLFRPVFNLLGSFHHIRQHRSRVAPPSRHEHRDSSRDLQIECLMART